MTKKPVSRRAFLRGSSGAIFLLPIADFTLRNGKLIAAETPNAPQRLFTMFFPNGAVGGAWNFGDSLSGAAALQSKILAIHNLANPAAAETNLAEGHGSGAATAFTGAACPGNDPMHLSGGPTLDQFCAQQLKPNTLLPSLVAGLCSQSAHHTGMFGLHCFVRSWVNNATYVSPTRNPLDAFNALFGPTWETVVKGDSDLARRRRSIMDTVLAQYKEVTTERYGLGKDGRALLGDHLDSLRELEKEVFKTDLQISEECKARPKAPGEIDPSIPYGIWEQTFDVHSDLIVQALKCDMVRFGNFSFGESAEYYVKPEINPKPGHTAAHDSEYPIYGAYIRYYIGLFARLWTKLDAVVEGNGKSILDNSLFYVATELGDQARPQHHAVDPTCVALVGGLGSHAKGQVIDGAGHTINDALGTAAAAMGLPREFGDPKYRRGNIG